jgi:ABC-2 type transport system permease protein
VIRITLALAVRSLRNALRRPQFLMPALLFPSILLAVNTGGLHRATQLPGFPKVPSFLSFQIPASMLQSLLLGGVSAGIAMALEIESGFFDRLVAAPIPRSAIVLGRLLATGALAAVQGLYFVLIGIVFNAGFTGGIGSVLVVLLVAAVAGTGFGAIGVLLALRARSASTVQSIFPLVFVVLFTSSAFFPRALLNPPVDTIARWNPLSYIANGLREPLIGQITAQPVLEGLAAALGVGLVAGLLSLQALHAKLGET